MAVLAYTTSAPTKKEVSVTLLGIWTAKFRLAGTCGPPKFCREAIFGVNLLLSGRGRAFSPANRRLAEDFALFTDSYLISSSRQLNERTKKYIGVAGVVRGCGRGWTPEFRRLLFGTAPV